MNEESIIILGFSESNRRKNLVGRKDKKGTCLAKPDHIKARAVCFQSVLVASTFGEIFTGLNRKPTFTSPDRSIQGSHYGKKYRKVPDC